MTEEVVEAPRKKDGKPGLKRMRKASGRAPMYPCDNCKCSRYSPCGCERKRKN